MIYAKCIKETYTWDGDGEQHRFPKVVEGHIYAFDRIKGIYWIVPKMSSTDDFKDSDGFISCVAHGLEQKYFNEMFEIL